MQGLPIVEWKTLLAKLSLLRNVLFNKLYLHYDEALRLSKWKLKYLGASVCKGCQSISATNHRSSAMHSANCVYTAAKYSIFQHGSLFATRESALSFFAIPSTMPGYHYCPACGS